MNSSLAARMFAYSLGNINGVASIGWVRLATSGEGCSDEAEGYTGCCGDGPGGIAYFWDTGIDANRQPDG